MGRAGGTGSTPQLYALFCNARRTENPCKRAFEPHEKMPRKNMNSWPARNSAFESCQRSHFSSHNLPSTYVNLFSSFFKNKKLLVTPNARESKGSWLKFHLHRILCSDPILNGQYLKKTSLNFKNTIHTSYVHINSIKMHRQNYLRTIFTFRHISRMVCKKLSS